MARWKPRRSQPTGVRAVCDDRSTATLKGGLWRITLPGAAPQTKQPWHRSRASCLT